MDRIGVDLLPMYPTGQELKISIVAAADQYFNNRTNPDALKVIKFRGPVEDYYHSYSHNFKNHFTLTESLHRSSFKFQEL